MPVLRSTDADVGVHCSENNVSLQSSRSTGRQYCSFLVPDGKLRCLPNSPTSRRKRVEDGLQGTAAGREACRRRTGNVWIIRSEMALLPVHCETLNKSFSPQGPQNEGGSERCYLRALLV